MSHNISKASSHTAKQVPFEPTATVNAAEKISKAQSSDSLQLSFGGFSCAGKKADNQDAFAAFCPRPHEMEAKGGVAAIADGVSSASKAAEAAQLAVTQFIEEYYCTPQTWSTRKSAAKVLTGLNQWLYSQTDSIASSIHNRDASQQWLTTFTAFVAKSSTGYVFHVGDTRLYRFRQGQLEQITRDHNRKQGQKRMILTRALGADPRLEVDFHDVEIQKDDMYLLSCDGVHDYLSDKQIKQILSTIDLSQNVCNSRLEQVSKSLTEHALNAGSHDNLSALVVHITRTPNRAMTEVERDLRDRVIPPALSVGMTLDSYKVCKVIHASIRSHLYLVEHIESTEKAVLKVPSENFSDDSLYLQGFIREAWVGERIQHNHIMRIQSAPSDSKFLYHLCEYIEGQTLTEWMHDNPKPSISQVRDIIAQIILALRKFQRFELVHRDLKPDNIMIDAVGNIKLIDYGTVLVASLEENNDTIEETMPQGSLNYIAPETLLALKANHQSDLFSLGVICFEMLCGELPYKPMQRAQITQHSYSDWTYRSIKQFRPDLPFG